MLFVLLEITWFGMIAEHCIAPVSSGCVELIVNVVDIVVAFFTTPIVVVFMLYLLPLTISLPSRYHLMIAAGFEVNSHVQLACELMSAIVVFDR